MNGEPTQKLGRIGWVDLTVADAPGIRDFYQAVIGWDTSECDMGDYSDYFMSDPGTGEAIAGVCHARGTNADLPSAWIIYVTVPDLNESIDCCTKLGGQVIAGPRAFGTGRYAVIRDPAGCVMGIYEPGEDES